MHHKDGTVLRMVCFKIVFIALLCSQNVDGAYDTAAVQKASTTLIKLKYNTFKDLLKSVVDSSSLTKGCSQSFKAILGLRDETSLLYIDSLGRLPDGIYNGERMAVSNFQQCLKLAEDGTLSKYCTFYVYPNHFALMMQNIKTEKLHTILMQNLLLVGSCLPANCTDQDAERLVQGLFSKTGSGQTVMHSLVECEDLSKPLPAAPTFLTVSWCFVILVVLGATLLHITEKCFNFTETTTSTLRQLSILQALESIFATVPEAGSIGCFNAIRVISMFWVVFLHTHIYMQPFFYGDSISFHESSEDILTQFRTNATLSVTSFAFISGFLLQISMQRRISKDDSNWKSMIVQRYLRLVPALLVAITLNYYLKNLRNGPLASTNRSVIIRLNWDVFLANALCYQNLSTALTPNLPHWYNALDFQLFLASFWLLSRYCRNGSKTLIYLVIVGTTAFTYWCTSYLGSGLGLLYYLPFNPEITNRESWKIYYSPFTHLSSYLIGALFAAYYHTKKSAKITQARYAVMFLIALSLILGVIIIPSFYIRAGLPSNHISIVLYSSLHKPLFAVGLGLLILCCIFNEKGVLNQVLSSSAWLPLSRLSFCIYLVHNMVVDHQWSSFKNPIPSTPFFMVTLVAGNLFLASILGFVFHCLVERPIGMVTDLLFKDKILKASKKKN